jgi:hypothetical protein
MSLVCPFHSIPSPLGLSRIGIYNLGSRGYFGKHQVLEVRKAKVQGKNHPEVMEDD